MQRKTLFTVAVMLGLAVVGVMAAPAFAQHAPGDTAWKPGYPQAGLHNSAEVVLQRFKQKAGTLGTGEKARILVIGDSLSDTYYTWTMYLRENLQAVYGQGGQGNIMASWGRNKDAKDGWLFTDQDYLQTSTGPWTTVGASSGRGDTWPYLGWNGVYVTTNAPEATYTLTAPATKVTLVYSTGSFDTFNGKRINNTSAGFTAKLDEQTQTVAPAKAGDPLDIGLLTFQTTPGTPHTLTISGIHGGTLYLHGVLLENEQRGVVVYNIAKGGWWWFHFLWRQPGFEKILQAMDPDLTIIYLSKPESRNSGESTDQANNPNYEYDQLTARLKAALPESDFLYFVTWPSRDPITKPNAENMKNFVQWLDTNHYPYLNLYEGLDRLKMAELGWYKDNIHPAPPGGKGVGDAISKLFLP